MKYIYLWSRIKTGYVYFSNCSGEQKNFELRYFDTYSFHVLTYCSLNNNRMICYEHFKIIDAIANGITL